MRTAVLLVAGGLSGGCCAAHGEVVVPTHEGGLAVATSEHEECAVSRARDLAQEDCKRRNMQVVFGETTTAYQGADPDRRADKDVGAMMPRQAPGSSVVATDQDYRAKVAFTCK